MSGPLSSFLHYSSYPLASFPLHRYTHCELKSVNRRDLQFTVSLKSVEETILGYPHVRTQMPHTLEIAGEQGENEAPKM